MALEVSDRKLLQPTISDNGEVLPVAGVLAVLGKNFEFKLPLALLYALPRESPLPSSDPAATKIRIRFSMWQNRLPVDALPVEGWLDLQLLPEMELMAMAH